MDEGLVQRFAALRAEEEAARATVAKALGAGLAGAVALTAAHETLRRAIPNPPRLDRIGVRALASAFSGLRQPKGPRLYALALAGDVIANGLYYGLLLTKRPFRPFTREAIGGTAAGLGAVVVPVALGRASLKKDAGADDTSRRLLTVGLYLFGGLAAASVFRLLAPRPKF